MKIDYLNKFKGALLGLAIGDTLGNPFNGELRKDILSKFERFETFINKNKRKMFKSYADNTQLAIHVAEALIQGKGFNINILIRELIKWLDDPPLGDAFTCISSISKLKKNVPWKEISMKSGGSGTLARTTPLALFYNNNLETLQEVAELTSLITHTHLGASGSAVVLARSIAYLINHQPNDEFFLNDFMDQLIISLSNSQKPEWDVIIDKLHILSRKFDLSAESGLIKFSQIGVEPSYYIEHYFGKAFIHPYALSTLICTLFLFIKQLDSFEEYIYTISTAGGGATAAAVGGAMAGAFHGYSNIPTKLTKIVKDSKYILNVAERLYDIYEKRNLKIKR